MALAVAMKSNVIGMSQSHHGICLNCMARPPTASGDIFVKATAQLASAIRLSLALLRQKFVLMGHRVGNSGLP
jgi:hypothetical protein